jgi:hypothetical protein
MIIQTLEIMDISNNMNIVEKADDSGMMLMDEGEVKKKVGGGSNRITKTEAQQSMLNRKQKKLVSRLNSSYCRTGKMDRILPILTGKSKISLRLIDWFVTNYAKIFNTHYSINEYKLKRENRTKKGKFTMVGKTLKKDKLKEEKEKKDKEINLQLSSTPPVIINPIPISDSVETEIKNNDEYFNDLFFVYPSYRQELKTNSKKRFDVFCRNGSFNYYYDDYKFIETNDGQLNFFDWADNMYVIDYIEEHYDEIEKDMELRNAKKPRSLKKGKGKKASTIACDNDLETISQKQRRKRREISESSLKTVHHIPHRSIISFD